MNVLIVDDEPIIRVGLKKLVDWDGNGFTLVGEASDGLEAIRMMEQTPVDILVTDIRMPGMDGLELIREAKKTAPAPGVIVRSCLDDFVFVREAMKLGAKDYLLKPSMEPEELVAVMSALREELQAERQDQLRLQEMRHRLEHTKPYRLGELIRQALEGRNGSDELQELWPRGTAGFSLLLYGCWARRWNSVKRDFDGLAGIIVWSGDKVQLLFALERTSSRMQAHRQMYGKAQEVMGLLSATGADSADMGNEGFVGMGAGFHRVEEAGDEWRLHQRQLQHRMYAECSDDLQASEDVPGEHDGVLPYEARNNLLKAMDKGNQEAVGFWCDEMFREISEERPTPAKLHAFLYETMGLSIGYGRAWAGSVIDTFRERYLQMDQIAAVFPLSRLHLWFRDGLLALVSASSIQLDSVEIRSPFVRKALQFMKEHYGEHIGTAEIADYVKLSRSYLSDIYSKETGESLIETLTRIRIEEAKRMLRAGKLKVYEVAEAVGFADPKNFAKTFRRLVGCTPKEYVAMNA